MDTGSANDHLRSVAPTLKRGRGSLRGRCVSNLDEESDPSGGEDLETQVSMGSLSYCLKLLFIKFFCLLARCFTGTTYELCFEAHTCWLEVD